MLCLVKEDTEKEGDKDWFGRGLWGCWLSIQFSSIISCISITEGTVSNEKNKVQKVRLPLSQTNYIKCSHKLFSCRFNVYPLYSGTIFFFFFRKTHSLHAPKGFQISFQLKAENLEVWLKISNVHIDAFFFSFYLKIYIVLQSSLSERLTIRRIISLALIYLCTFSKLLCLKSSKTDVFNK